MGNAQRTAGRLNYKRTAILVEFIEHLVDAGQQIYGEANLAKVPYDSPGMAAWRDEVGLVQRGVLSRPDLQELVAEFKRKREESRDGK